MAGRTNGAEWSGRLACVLGLGRSGIGAARLLLARGARVRALERDATREILRAWEPLAGAGAELITGPHPPTALEGCDLLVRSPGVPDEAPLLQRARASGMPVLSEVEIAARAIATPILAITGTNGKSTTTAWAAHLLRRAGLPAVACGNIGHALSAAFLESAERPGPSGAPIFVVEISSFQLLDSPSLHPRGAAILNITPDHLDRHHDFASYAEAKWAVARNQEPGDVLAVGRGLAQEARARTRATVVECDAEDRGSPDALFSREGALWYRRAGAERRLLAVSELALPGPHNLENAMAAVAACSAVADPAELLAGLRDFAGLPHRLEHVATVDGVRFINDSKATNVDSMRVALETFDEPVVLIAGGRDKEGDFEAIGELVARRVRHIVAIGEAAGRIRSAYAGVSSETAPSFVTAIARALAAANGRGVVLLSPGCASYDMFRNYEHRGDSFKEIVKGMAGAH